MERVNIFRPASFSTAEINKIAAAADKDYTIIYTRPTELKFINFGLERMVQVADDTAAAMVYSDHFNGEEPAPVIDYQEGSLRDDFDFGGVQMYRTSVLKEAVAGMDVDYQFAGLYDLRLRASRMTSPDIRAGIALLIAAMSAEGTSTISNIQQIDRGYEDIEARLNALAAAIKRIE